MIRRFVRGVIHNATVTHADPSWPVSLRIDPVLLRAIEVLPLEEVEIVNTATGERFTTWAQEGAAGEVRVHGGTSHHVRAGDVISIVSHGLLHDGQTLAHRARVVTLGAANAIVSITES
jgi:aspartate 1-decarboxylase